MSVYLDFLKNFIDFFNDWPSRARLIFNIEISGTKTSKPIGSPPFLHKPILHTLGPTQPIQHTIVPPRAYYSTSVVPHEAAMYDSGRRSNTRRFCTCFDTARHDSAQPPIHHIPIQHNPFLHISFSPQSWSCTTVPSLCIRIYFR